ncbi:helix-turn-helix domain-containing protein [Hyalangium rubrum]|uniref:Helix-turn-helix transcriptional regulator n=1 Tax=Hyalangium rubrum TaxID=3103134 RepID=A0ABU5HKH6_9BACT|nr:helix-turn-helix transcriptional regulator [Hyalangium sp. s54d21]MDY7233322.1 helix-turn-helix transcriptional regulator [Hyalangium sp. s54d21]
MPRATAKTPAAAHSRRPTARGRKRPSPPRHIEIRQSRLASTIGAVAKQARTRAGLTQADVAAALGTHPEVYGRMERGEVMPSVPTLMRMCLTLGCGPHELMGFAEVEPGQSVPGAHAVLPGLNDTPEKRRLLRRLARLDSPRIKTLARLVALLLPGR